MEVRKPRLPWIFCSKCGIAIELPEDERAPGNDAVLVRHMNAIAAAHEKSCLGTGVTTKPPARPKARKRQLDEQERELQKAQERLNKEALKLVQNLVNSFFKK